MQLLSKLSVAGLLLAPLVAGAPAPIDASSRLFKRDCGDNLGRKLKKSSVQASSFCATFTLSAATAGQSYPAFLSEYTATPSKISSACTCAVTAPRSTTVSQTSTSSSAVTTSSSSTIPTTTSFVPTTTSSVPTTTPSVPTTTPSVPTTTPSVPTTTPSVSTTTSSSTTSSTLSTITTTSSIATPTTSSTTTSSNQSTTSSSSVSVSTSASTTAASTTLLASKTATSTGLDSNAKATGLLYFGTAADIPGTAESSDAGYMSVLNRQGEFGQLTPANTMKWMYTEPQRGVFDYSGAEQFLSIAEANDQIVRCHNLVWYNQLPYWLTSQTWDNATLISILENHITNVVTRFGSRCYAWDVVNEALNDDGTWRPTVFYNVIGPSYIKIAFAAAAAAAPANVKLYYNDYNIEYNGAKSQAARALIIQPLINAGIRIDGVGLQAHFIIGQTPGIAAQTSNMQNFANLGLDVAITELDIRSPNMPPTVAQQKQQAVDYYNTVRACLGVPRCVGVTLWDFLDEYSWIPSTFKGQGYGTPWVKLSGTDTPVAKIAYDGIVNALTGAGVPTF